MNSTFANRPLVCAITRGDAVDSDFAAAKDSVLKLVGAATEFGIPFVQIREKKLCARFLFELASAAAQLSRGTATTILVNERADVALAAGAGGVHLRSDGLPASTIREKFSRPFLIGVSTHSIDEILGAKAGGADFAMFGPVFRSPGKGAPVGIEALREAQSAAGEFPVLALGGVDETNWRECLDAARGFAAIRFLAEDNGPKTVGDFLKQ